MRATTHSMSREARRRIKNRSRLSPKASTFYFIRDASILLRDNSTSRETSCSLQDRHRVGAHLLT